MQAARTCSLSFPTSKLDWGKKAVYNELKDIKKFRNRIAHNEPICFDVMGNRSLAYAQENYKQIVKYIQFLGYTEKQILYGYNVNTQVLTNKIKSM